MTEDDDPPVALYATMSDADLERLMRAFLWDWQALDDGVADAFIAGRLKAIWHELARRRYVIWSFEHNAWWRPGGMGYTPSLAAAGRYSPADAAAIVDHANRYSPTINEVAIRDPAPSDDVTDLIVQAVRALMPNS